jgi:hypothetical protein
MRSEVPNPGAPCLGDVRRSIGDRRAGFGRGSMRGAARRLDLVPAHEPGQDREPGGVGRRPGLGAAGTSPDRRRHRSRRMGRGGSTTRRTARRADTSPAGSSTPVDPSRPQSASARRTARGRGTLVGVGESDAFLLNAVRHHALRHAVLVSRSGLSGDLRVHHVADGIP